MTTFTDSTPGTSKTWTVPAGVTALTVIHLYGGGAGGQTDVSGGYGGGGGGHVYKATVTVSPGDVITYDVGAGGASDTHGSGTNVAAMSLQADGGGITGGFADNRWGGHAYGGTTNDYGSDGGSPPSGNGGKAGGSGGGTGGTGTAYSGNPGNAPGGGGGGNSTSFGAIGGAGANGLIQWDYASPVNKLDAIWFGMSF